MRLVTSKHLVQRKSKGTDTVFVYHSVLNSPRILDSNALSLLDFFSAPRIRQEAYAEFSGDIDQVIDSLIDIHFLEDTDSSQDLLSLIVQKRNQELVHRVVERQTISRVELAISNACNLGCSHCMHFLNQGIEERKGSSLLMTIETAKYCIDSVIKNLNDGNDKTIRIHMGNGEPLLNWKTLTYVINYCKTIPKVDFTFAINTNLTALTFEKAVYLKNNNVKIATSLDGTKSINDMARPYQNGNGSFDKTVEGFRILKEIGHPVEGFTATVTKNNFYLTDKSLIDMACDLWVQDITLDFDLVSCIDISTNEMVNLIKQLRTYAASKGINLYGTWESPFKNLMSESLLLQSYGFCPAFEGKTLSFDVDGSIKLCGHTNTKVGHAEDMQSVFSETSDFSTLLASRLPGNNIPCKGCEIEAACSGQCHVTVESSTRDPKLFNSMCDLMRQSTSMLIEESLAQMI